MKVLVKKYHKDAVIPSRAYDKDYGYDCVAISEEEIAPNVWKYGLGIGLQLQRDLELIQKREDELDWEEFKMLNMEISPLNLCIDARPRSSVWKTGMILSNCIGTIDEGYINEISAVFYHVMPDMPRYKVGDRVCQIMINATFPMDFKVVKELDANQERGMKGYGSSNK